MRYVEGNLLEAQTEALINTVNTVGIMGKGIALQFKNAFPNNYKLYDSACKNNELAPGKLLVVKESVKEGDKIIINFPTKTEWFKKSQYNFIELGLQELVKIIKTHNIKSIALPPLGCGNGGLQWDKVKLLLENYLGNLQDIDVVVYEPNEKVKELLKKQETPKEIKLTPAKALLLYSMFYYESLGERTSLFAANKLAYFLQRLGEVSLKNLKFNAHHYGPYSIQVQHMLYDMNGKYIKGLEQMQAKAFEPLDLQYSTLPEVANYIKQKLSYEQKIIIKQLVSLIDGYQSELSLEILASVDYVRKNNPGISINDALKEIKWNDRKKRLFKNSYIDTAWKHLTDYSQNLNFN